MKRMLFTLLTLFTAVLVTQPLLAEAVAAETAPFQAGELLVILAEDTPVTLGAHGELAATNADLAAVLADHQLDRYEMILHKTTWTERDRRYLRLRSTRPDFDPIAAAQELTASGLFRAVSPNYQMQLFVLPNDPYRSTQWYVDTPNGADIHLPEAWDVTQGSAESVIAILDTGLDWSHPDLSGNAWHNPGEIPNNSIDDDGNGYVDDVYGWDCGEGDNDARPDPYFELGIDVGFHGTHCAGIASATTNNGVGIAGAGWSCSLLGLKLTSAAGSFSTAAVTEAFLYAIDEQADVISMSFGGTYQDFGFMQSLVNDATAAGIVCVAAAGNNNTSQVMYPAGLTNVVSVGATNSSNQRASFSTYGNWVDVAAPGEQIWSTVQTNYEWDFLTQLLFMLSYGWDGVNPYMYSDGTSMACPLVAGVCGLIRSVAPDLPAADVAQRLIDTGDHVSYDQPIGVKVNAFAAVDGLVNTAVGDEMPGLVTRLAGYPNPFNPLTTLYFSLAEASGVRLGIYDLSGRQVRELLAQPMNAGDHAVLWDGCDSNGRNAASGVYFARLSTGVAVYATKLVLAK